MKSINLRKLLIPIMIMLWGATSCTDKHAVTAEQITKFYKDYISGIENLKYEEYDLILKEHTTPEVYAKIDRSGSSTWADPVIRAQDVCSDMFNSANATHLEDDWYMVTYYWNVNDSSTVKQIPLKAVTIDGKLMITYLPHELNGSKYGDDLLVCPTRNRISDISQASALEFLKSFYDVYLYNYCIMSLDLYPNLKELRSRYLSENALAQFKKEDDANLYDSMEGFDLLIYDFEFDPMWYNSLKITDMGSNRYEVTFIAGSYQERLILTVIKSDNGYLIDSIEHIRN